MRCGRMNALYPTGKVSELGNPESPDRELGSATRTSHPHPLRSGASVRRPVCAVVPKSKTIQTNAKHAA